MSDKNILGVEVWIIGTRYSTFEDDFEERLSFSDEMEYMPYNAHARNRNPAVSFRYEQSPKSQTRGGKADLCSMRKPSTETQDTGRSLASSMSIIEGPLSLSPTKTWRERRAFAYYSQHAAPLFGGLDANCWSTIIPGVYH
ncbi:hypothetical protein BDW62DRAFT_204706 [Aspergillus aurantiobrunneus]